MVKFAKNTGTGSIKHLVSFSFSKELILNPPFSKIELRLNVGGRVAAVGRVHDGVLVAAVDHVLSPLGLVRLEAAHVSRSTQSFGTWIWKNVLIHF